MQEEWKDISGYEGMYQVSNLGRVKSVDREICHLNRWGTMQNRKITGRILSLSPSADNYLTVILNKDGESKSWLVHRLVASEFISNPYDLPQVNHKDENPLNNTVDNLEWCTAKYNSNYGNRNSRIGESQKGKVVSYETKHNMSIRKSGSSNPMYGRVQSAESRSKISEALKGIKRSPEYIDKMRKRMLGHVPWNKGKHANKIICLDAGLTFDSCEDAAKWVGNVTPNAIQYVLKRIACCKGHVFVYSNNIPEDIPGYVAKCKERYRKGSKAGRPCRCVEDDTVFKYITEAAKYYNVSYEKIRSCLIDGKEVTLPNGRIVHFERAPYDDDIINTYNG